jgi:radical SAM-linked protein
MARRVPEGPPPPPVVARIRVRYAKRGRLRFASHRDFARAFERALRRADVPMAYSAGFTPHPKISYVGAAPTGAASEAEYLEVGLAREMDSDALRARLDAALPPGLDIIEALPAGVGSLAERMEASQWQIVLPGVHPAAAQEAVDQFLARDEVRVERLTKNGRRHIDVRAAVLRVGVGGAETNGETDGGYVAETGGGDVRAILDVVVRQVTPTVRPDDVVAALHDVAALAPTGPPLATRLAQGPVDAEGAVGDPLAPDRSGAGQPANS